MSSERADLIQTLRRHRGFLRFTVQDLTDEQAATPHAVSVLSLGSIIKHVAITEAQWMRFATGGAEGMMSVESDWENGHRMLPGETLAGLLATYDDVAAQTDRLVESLDLDIAHPLPEAPWFEQGAKWSVRRVLLHIIAETSQHAGHADILRETVDGQRTMG